MRYQILPKGVRNLDTATDIAPDQSSAEWQAYRQWLKEGNTPLPPEAPAPVVPTTADIVAAVTLATQARLDTFARTRNYDNILSAATYATSTVPKFTAEGQYAVEARDSTWAALYQIMAEVQAGTRPMPESFADVEPLLPVLEWPV